MAKGWSQFRSIFTLLAINLVPVAGVLWLGWDAGQILLLYWFENLILGLLTLPRLLVAGRGRLQAFGLAAFFCLHYGLFCLGHLMFVRHLTKSLSHPTSPAFASTDQSGFWLSVLAIFLINLIDQIRQWWMPGHWRTTTVGREMARPYGRIVLLHVTILVAAMAMAGLGGPATPVIILCGLKLAIELAPL